MDRKNAHPLLRVGAVATVLLGTAVAPGCLKRPIEPQDPRTTSTIVERLTQSQVDKIDILLMIDNSRSMADKQEILQLAVPDLVNQLVNPRCLNEDGTPAAQQPADPLAECPVPGTKREFDPILNIHVGIVSSSLGGHGADACSATMSPSENDKGELISRSGTGPMDPPVPTWNDAGFLVWDPCGATSSGCDATHEPPGTSDGAAFVADVTTMVGGVGEIGCGYEANLESWYRFLVDPEPYDTISIQDDTAVLEGTDDTLLAQRRDFLRPDSLLAIVMLTDENDCSIRDGGQFYFAAQIYQPGTNTPYHLPKPRAACATDPNDPCCRSCGQGPGQGCDAGADDCMGSLGGTEDHINLRCYDQKRRFGIDFLYPTDRYVTGLTQPQVTDRFGNVVPNPLFLDLNTEDDNSAVRNPGLVFIAGLVGVPWQDIARKNDAGDPDLLNGKNASGEVVGGFQDGAELVQNGTWDIILGDPSCYHTDPGCLPADPLMIESVNQRSGTNPVTGEPLADGSNPLGNSVNGNEYTVSGNDDLQYACIFGLPTIRDCATNPGAACDCIDGNTDNPLCCNPASPGSCAPDMFGTTQYSAKGYPGIRSLQVLKNVGLQGIVASICPAQLGDQGQFDYGYRPAVGAIIERLKQALGGQCLPRTLTANGQGQVPCIILEALRTNDNAACQVACAKAGRTGEPIPLDNPAVQAALEDPLAATGQWNCFCEILQLTGADLDACQTDISETPVNANGDAVNGWCYVDATTVPPTGNPDIVADCPETEKRIVRFVGEGQGQTGATLFITCSGD
jgi:hypothetical protein